MAYIEVIEHENADGRLKEVYDDLVQSRGKLAEVHKIQSLHPESIVAHMDLYMSIMYAKSPLKRYQREMIAVVVSKANDCEYCQRHHADALQHYWKDEQKVEALRNNFRDVELSAVDEKLCELGDSLTKAPGKHTEEAFIQPLKDLGLSDRAILDATLVTAYFNFVNRMVLGLGVHLENNLAGYKY